jgi:UDP-N-acetylmuramoylalanine--D-glutamate ligase
VKNYSGQKVVVVGAARQGTALARYLVRYGAQVVLTDARPLEDLAAAREALAGLPGVTWVCGGHPFSLLDGTSLLCPSGGVPLNLPLIGEAVRRGIPLSNDSQIFLEAAPCPVVGITGSAGKTTTTTLVGRMAEASSVYRRIWTGGNIGSPLIAEVDAMQPEDLAVMELSSFQLEIMTRSPQVAAVLNVTPNHLDRHGAMETYTAAKARILEFQGGTGAAVLGREDPGAWDLREKVRGRLVSFGMGELPTGSDGTFLVGEDLYLRNSGNKGMRGTATTHVARKRFLMKRSDILLRGEHNLLNVLAACTIAATAGLPVEAMRAGVEGFRGVAHRLELVRTWGGADWFNDSIATAPERSMAAIRSFDEPLVLLAGGRDKNLPWEEFGALVRQRVDHLIVFGECGEKVLAAVEEESVRPYTISRCATLREAVTEAARIVQPGDVVLLSPGGTSFDEFRDFEERGEWYKKWVMGL